MTNTIDYYNNNAQAFYNRTIHADLSAIYDDYLPLLPIGSCILDAGCGSGRDSKFFISKGFKVLAFDASTEMVKLATNEIGQNVYKMRFQEMAFCNLFDGVWANASLLHIPFEETRSVFKLIHRSLKSGGIFYGSYKYGQDRMPTEEREFYNMNELTILPHLEDLFEIIKIWRTEDTRSQVSPSPNKGWLNFLAKKKG